MIENRRNGTRVRHSRRVRRVLTRRRSQAVPVRRLTLVQPEPPRERFPFGPLAAVAILTALIWLAAEWLAPLLGIR